MSDRGAAVDAIFDRAASLITEGWSREHFSTNAAGEPRPFDASDTVRFTSAHALQRAAWDVVGVAYEADWYVCVHFFEEALRANGWTDDALPVWSDFDASARSEDDVLATLAIAKGLARSGGYALPPSSRLYAFWTAARLR